MSIPRTAPRGSFVLVDEQSNNTVAAGMIIKSLDESSDDSLEVAI